MYCERYFDPFHCELPTWTGVFLGRITIEDIARILKQKGRFMAGKIVSHAYWEHTGKDRIKLLKGSTQCLQCIVHNLYLFPDPEDTCI